jgi:hypothetical protein
LISDSVSAVVPLVVVEHAARIVEVVVLERREVARRVGHARVPGSTVGMKTAVSVSGRVLALSMLRSRRARPNCESPAALGAIAGLDVKDAEAMPAASTGRITSR